MSLCVKMISTNETNKTKHMKKDYFKLLFFGLFAFAIKANAQCSSCTITISGADAANHIVTSGTTLCITSTGSASGLISIASGGMLCNQGTMTSAAIYVNGGTLNNYGSITSNGILVNAQGVFNNYQSADVDSLWVRNIYSSLNNTGTLTDMKLGVSDYASITNGGDITADYVGDSAAQFNNNFNLTVNVDFGSTYNSGFFNAGYMSIGHDFYNASGSTFETNCMINVGHDWLNSAIVNGPPTGSCGGFNITGVSASSGTLGTSSTHLDLCDAGHPGTGIDGPGGTIATTTTYCTCSNSCVIMVAGIKENNESNVLIQTIYPNPASTNLTIGMQSKYAEQLQIEVLDMTGRKQIATAYRSSVGDSQTTIDVSGLAAGIYVLRIQDDQHAVAQKSFIVVK